METNAKYFTKQYYLLTEKIKRISQVAEVNTRFTFREKKEESLYQGIAVEIVQEELCQLSCEWCYINQRKKEQLHAPLHFGDFKKIVDKITEYNDKHAVRLFSNMIFIGGEPTLNKELDLMIKYSLKNNLSPIIVTNGYKLADSSYAESICLDGVNITVHIPLMEDDGVLDQFTGKKGYSEKLIQAIANMIKIRQSGKNIQIVGEFVVCKSTIDYAYKAYVFCREQKIDPFFELMRISNDEYSNKKLLLDTDDIVELAEKIYTYDWMNGYVADDEVSKIRYFLPPAINSPCTIIQNSIHVKFEKSGFGKVISCCGQDINHGNIMIDSMENILKHKENTKIFSEQKNHIKGPCSICELYDITGCEGGCRGNAKNTFQNPEASDPQCIFIKPEWKNNKAIMTKEMLCGRGEEL